ncbi:GNAT family N-acetyltransferase [Mycetocola reblochoni]|uniref:N-acetyltransferase n=1 Tax=Mycetocola reblochoni TaxID=331618 RepID=A0A3L6ZT88_9MICO|nr:GNAT family protein [Mycetocola reblochoni]RLP71019.1 N-acetyltransferase [Mycetocola reblochoni]
MLPVILRTERLELSVPVEDDIDPIFRACQDPDIQKWTTVPVPYRRVDASTFVSSVVGQGWRSGDSLTWGIRRSGELVGVIDLHDVADRGAEIGYWLGRQWRGEGLLREAARAVIDFAFSAPPHGLALERLAWRAGLGNVDSARVAQALGFRFEGCGRKDLVQRGARSDSWSAGMLAAEDRSPVDWPSLPGGAGGPAPAPR